MASLRSMQQQHHHLLLVRHLLHLPLLQHIVKHHLHLHRRHLQLHHHLPLHLPLPLPSVKHLALLILSHPHTLSSPSASSSLIPLQAFPPASLEFSRLQLPSVAVNVLLIAASSHRFRSSAGGLRGGVTRVWCVVSQLLSSLVHLYDCSSSLIPPLQSRLSHTPVSHWW